MIDGLISRIRGHYQTLVWDTEPATVAGWQRWLIRLARLAQAVARDLASGAITLRAMGLVFTTLLAFVPFLAVSFSVLKGFGVHNRIEPVLYRLLAPLGPKAEELTERIVGFVDNIEVGVLGAVGIGVLLYTAVSLVQKIEEAFNYTWNVHRKRTLVRRFSDYFSVIAVGPVLVFTSLGMTAALANSDAVRAIAAIEPFGSLLQILGQLIPYLLVILAFAFIYILIPNTRVRVVPAFVGAVIAGIAWESIGRLFTGFVATSTNYTAIYSSFAILLLFMIWLYLSWVVLLTGSSIAFYWQNPAYLHAGGRRGRDYSAVFAERLALAIMRHVVAAWYARARAPTRADLGEALAAPRDVLERVLDNLIEAGLLAAAEGDPPGYLPACPPEKTPAKRVLDAVRGANAWGGQGRGDDPPEEQLLARADRAVDAALADVYLSDLGPAQE